MQNLILVVFLAAASLASHANDAAQGLFLKTRCEGKLASVVLSSFKDAVSASQKFRLVLGRRWPFRHRSNRLYDVRREQ